MPAIHIALEEGFMGDAVSVAIDGKNVFSEDSVKTRMQIGLAREFEVEVPAGAARVDVSLPAKNLARSIALEVSGKLYLAVSLTPEGTLEHKVASEPFRYA